MSDFLTSLLSNLSVGRLLPANISTNKHQVYKNLWIYKPQVLGVYDRILDVAYRFRSRVQP